MLGDNLLALIKLHNYLGIPLPTVKRIAKQVPYTRCDAIVSTALHNCRLSVLLCVPVLLLWRLFVCRWSAANSMARFETTLQLSVSV